MRPPHDSLASLALLEEAGSPLRALPGKRGRLRSQSAWAPDGARSATVRSEPPPCNGRLAEKLPRAFLAALPRAYLLRRREGASWWRRVRLDGQTGRQRDERTCTRSARLPPTRRRRRQSIAGFGGLAARGLFIMIALRRFPAQICPNSAGSANPLGII